MLTFVAEVGTPPHQLLASNQSVLVVPSQLPPAPTMTEIFEFALTHPVVLFVTFRVPVYVPAATAPGTAMTIGLAGNKVFGTFMNPAVIAPALHVMLY